MEKMLFISNISNRITNFAIPSIETAQRLGYEVHLAANYSKFNDNPDKYNVRIHNIDFNRNPFNIVNIKAYKQMIKLMKEEKFDFVHCNTPIGGIIGRLCAKKMGVRKIIYTAHGFHFYKGAPFINRTVFKAVEKWLAQYTDALITITKEDFNAAKEFSLRNKGKVYYVPGVGINRKDICNVSVNSDDILKEFEINSNNFIIISAGELNDNKNQEVIIKALNKLNNPNIHYLVCGKGPKEEYLKKLTIEKKLENNVHFLGYRTDVIELMKSSNAFVMPSYREGLSRSIMEAMACGLPIIASKIRGNVDLVREDINGFLIEPCNYHEMSKSIEKLINNYILCEKIKKNNIRDSSKYDTKVIKEFIERIYREVL